MSGRRKSSGGPRKPGGTGGRSPPVSRRLTLDDAILIHRRRAAGEAQHVIAAELNVNPGRVSEVLKGKRFPEARGPLD